MNKSAYLILLVSIISSRALASENNGLGYDLTRRKSEFNTNTESYKTEVYIVCSTSGTTIMSHVATFDPTTRKLLEESYQGSTVSTTAALNGPLFLPELCFTKIKSQWKEQAAKNSLTKIKDKILRRKSIG